jgi:hypothetical protein
LTGFVKHSIIMDLPTGTSLQVLAEAFLPSDARPHPVHDPSLGHGRRLDFGRLGVPSYRLAAAHQAVQGAVADQALSLWGGLRAPWLTLWDEAGGRLVSFREAARAAA